MEVALTKRALCVGHPPSMRESANRSKRPTGTGDARGTEHVPVQRGRASRQDTLCGRHAHKGAARGARAASSLLQASRAAGEGRTLRGQQTPGRTSQATKAARSSGEGDAPHRQIAHAACDSGNRSGSTPAGKGAKAPTCVAGALAEASPGDEGAFARRRRHRRQSWRRGLVGCALAAAGIGEGDPAEAGGGDAASIAGAGSDAAGDGSSGSVPLRRKTGDIRDHAWVRKREGERARTNTKTRCGRLAMSSFLRGPISFFFCPTPNQRAPICKRARR